jgi:hypothetical protein
LAINIEYSTRAVMGKEDLGSEKRPPVIRLNLIRDCPNSVAANWWNNLLRIGEKKLEYMRITFK